MSQLDLGSLTVKLSADIEGLKRDFAKAQAETKRTADETSKLSKSFSRAAEMAFGAFDGIGGKLAMVSEKIAKVGGSLTQIFGENATGSARKFGDAIEKATGLGGKQLLGIGEAAKTASEGLKMAAVAAGMLNVPILAAAAAMVGIVAGYGALRKMSAGSSTDKLASDQKKAIEDWDRGYGGARQRSLLLQLAGAGTLSPEDARSLEMLNLQDPRNKGGMTSLEAADKLDGGKSSGADLANELGKDFIESFKAGIGPIGDAVKPLLDAIKGFTDGAGKSTKDLAKAAEDAAKAGRERLKDAFEAFRAEEDYRQRDAEAAAKHSKALEEAADKIIRDTSKISGVFDPKTGGNIAGGSPTAIGAEQRRLNNQANYGAESRNNKVPVTGDGAQFFTALGNAGGAGGSFAVGLATGGAPAAVAQLIASSSAFATIVQQATEIFGTIAELVGLLLEPLIPFIEVIAMLASVVGTVITPVFKILADVLKLLWPVLKVVAQVALAIVRAISWVWNGIISAIQWVINKIGDALDWVYDGWGDGLHDMANSLDSWKADMGAISDAQHALESATFDEIIAKRKAIDPINDLGNAAREAAEAMMGLPEGYKIAYSRYSSMQTRGGAMGSLGTIPSFASGGYVPRPTLAMIGDAPGGEYVVPARQAGAMGTTVNVQIVSNDPESIWRKLAPYLRRETLRQTGSIVAGAPRFAVPQSA